MKRVTKADIQQSLNDLLTTHSKTLMENIFLKDKVAFLERHQLNPILWEKSLFAAMSISKSSRSLCMTATELLKKTRG